MTLEIWIVLNLNLSDLLEESYLLRKPVQPDNPTSETLGRRLFRGGFDGTSPACISFKEVAFGGYQVLGEVSKHRLESWVQGLI